jgi:hypothetical protein
VRGRIKESAKIDGNVPSAGSGGNCRKHSERLPEIGTAGPDEKKTGGNLIVAAGKVLRRYRAEA